MRQNNRVRRTFWPYSTWFKKNSRCISDSTIFLNNNKISLHTILEAMKLELRPIC